ncbi:carboxypeptidase-like regulatory domain-containing protein [Aestuariibaculum marinum]|uniref:Carboxypeptidase-like regulatory domain-containing protein n=1 Tax=Aestuariibaculum marinum TaxID=2683592 RepID=A0A8J6QD86_9FLAO|nr:carboxypeptidase-like regulatory domain-containing protein [Aestuariibaculum marinum]MBD0825006.1 carboxypeptidase-like regulatory domain-containing protein [Aestuariibaculum marinum]
MLCFIESKHHKILLYLVLLVMHFGYAQNADEAAMSQILVKIERQYNVKFSYAPDDVANLHVEMPKPEFSLSQVIEYLNRKTVLNFKTLDNRYITVSKANKTITVCGQVFAVSNKQTLMGASVYIKNSTKGMVTDAQGYFELTDVSLESVIGLSYIGFKEVEFPAAELFSGNTACESIFLEANSEQLNQIVITKFLTTGVQKLVDGSTVLNTKAFGILPGLIDPDVLQSIQTLPGIESVNESIANINVRGGTNDQNLILWDGIKMYHSGHFFGLISAYNPNLTDRVIVTKNGTSSEFSDGVSSTIDMRTKNELIGEFSGGFGTNLISADVFLEMPISKSVELHVSGRRSFTDAFKTLTYNNYFDRSFQDSDIRTQKENSGDIDTASDFKFYDYTAKVLFDLNENHKFRANFIEISNNLGYNESVNDASGETQAKSSNLSQKNTGFGGHWLANWTDAFNTSFNAYYSKYKVDAQDYNVESDQLLTQVNEVLETGFKVSSNYKVNNNLKFLNGYQFNETGILNETAVTSPAYNRTKKDVLRNHALYSQLELKALNTFLRAGVRLNYFEKFNRFLFEPRLNVRQKLIGAFSLKLEGEFKNQSATQVFDFTDDFLGVEKRRWILANEQSIPISKSKQGSIGMELNRNDLNIGFSGFYKKVKGITASNQGFYNNFQSLSAIGEYSSRGLEFLANKTTNKYSTWLSYTYSINDYKFQTFEPSVFPNNVDIRHSLLLAFNYNVLDNLKISVGGLWRSGLPYTKPVEGNETVQSGNNVYVNYDAPNSENLDVFRRVDVSLSYKFKMSTAIQAALKVGVLNLTNSKNIINRYYKVDPENSEQTIQVDNTSLPLTPNVSFRFLF